MVATSWRGGKRNKKIFFWRLEHYKNGRWTTSRLLTNSRCLERQEGHGLDERHVLLWTNPRDLVFSYRWWPKALEPIIMAAITSVHVHLGHSVACCIVHWELLDSFHSSRLFQNTAKCSERVSISPFRPGGCRHFVPIKTVREFSIVSFLKFFFGGKLVVCFVWPELNVSESQVSWSSCKMKKIVDWFRPAAGFELEIARVADASDGGRIGRRWRIIGHRYETAPRAHISCHPLEFHKRRERREDVRWTWGPRHIQRRRNCPAQNSWKVPPAVSSLWQSFRPTVAAETAHSDAHR